MQLKLKGKTIQIQKLTSFWERFKTMMFVFEPLQTGFCYPKKRGFQTYMFCQKVDLVFTDKDWKVLYLYPNLKSEKMILPKRHVYYVFLLPLKTCQELEIGQKLTIIEEKKKS